MQKRAFSLVEVVIVCVIIGMLAAVAIPKFGYSNDQTVKTQLVENLNSMRTAIGMYWFDHGRYPSGTGAEVATQIAEYLHDGIPEAPMGKFAGDTSIFMAHEDHPPRTPISFTPLGGWIYSSKHGEIWLNSADTAEAAH